MRAGALSYMMGRMDPATLTKITLAAMLHLLPPEAAVKRTLWPKEARETVAERTDRYRAIATAIGDVTSSQPLIVKGKHAHVQTIAVMLAVTYHESAWARHVDLGIGPYSRGDRGNSWCLGQHNIGRGKTKEGWTGPELVADRRKCMTATLRVLRSSFSSCRRNPLELRLAAYASGSCKRGHRASRRRMHTALQLLPVLTRAQNRVVR